ncbi:DUF551 domain-containing protein [bacterium]|nr:DUF551 domain-containing protein [bacterium]
MDKEQMLEWVKEALRNKRYWHERKHHAEFDFDLFLQDLEQILNSLSDGWISVEDELPEVNQSVDMVLVDFKSFEGDQDGIDKVYGVYWDGEQWFYEPGIPIENKVLRWIIVEAPGENTNS